MLGDAPAPRTLITSRLALQGQAHDEESRAFLQSRLTVLSKLMFWSFVVLLGGMVALYRQYPSIEPGDNDSIYAIGAAGVLVLAIIWRGFLVRRQLRLEALIAIDLFYATATGSIFGAASYLAWELRSSAFANLLWSCFMVFLRCIVVPSTGFRTAIAGALTFVPILVAAVGLALTTTQELPPLAYVSSAAIISSVVVLLATIGSRILYGLRKQVSAAMRLGQYTIDRKIGEGGNGTVYRAHHAMLRRPTAIKLIQPDKAGAENVDRFEREVQHMSQLTHWNNVAVYDYGRSPEGYFYYAMEYLDGIDLENLVVDFGPQPADRVVEILVQVCSALSEAHRRGIIHRDIKPANILLCERGDVPDVAKVVDYGLAKVVDSRVGDTSRSILGTPAYISPEAVTDPTTMSPAADLYALGAVGYFLLTGRRVFEAKTNVDLCVQHVTATPKPPSTVTTRKIPPALEEAILRCLAKKPADRPESAAVLATLLRAAATGTGWSEDDARRWWADFRRQDRPLGPGASTQTITVDIEARLEDPYERPSRPELN
ncbi:MAG: serine/threonine protein kinase [Kofleriaceae bacterium]|nr:serine/threonine protein kinase [Kofleriaceae bacterium]